MDSTIIKNGEDVLNEYGRKKENKELFIVMGVRNKQAKLFILLVRGRTRLGSNKAAKNQMYEAVSNLQISIIFTSIYILSYNKFNGFNGCHTTRANLINI